MLDLETMGTLNNAAIVSIGAVYFDNDGASLNNKFYTNIELSTAVDMGGVIDANTVMWWMKQSDAARTALQDSPMEINLALLEFQKFVEPDTRVWGNGSDFDNVILRNTYQRSGLITPWWYINNRCYRTIKNEFGSNIPYVRFGSAHNALDDAISQAIHLAKIYEEYGWKL